MYLCGMVTVFVPLVIMNCRDIQSEYLQPLILQFIVNRMLVAKYISHSVLRKKKKTSYRLTQCEYPPMGFSCCFLSLPVLLK